MPQKIKSDVTLGQNIRSIRKSKKLTQEQVSTKMQLLGIDITRSIYSQIECGTYNIKVTELAALHLIFDVDYNAFFENIEIVKPSSNDEKILKYTGY